MKEEEEEDKKKNRMASSAIGRATLQTLTKTTYILLIYNGLLRKVDGDAYSYNKDPDCCQDNI